MDKNTARQLVKKTFQNPFDKGSFVYFIKNLLNEIDESKAFHTRGYVHKKYRDKIKTYERIGTYTDLENNKIDILIVYLQKEGSIDRARTTLRNFASDYLKERDEKDAGLIAFVSPSQKEWRFSLVKMEYKLGKTQTGRVRAREELTPARRYSFLVGIHESSHTAQSQLVPILEDDVNNPTLKQLEELFNIEKVTKEFFEKYRELFLKVKENLDEIVLKDKRIKDDFKNKGISTTDFAKKLLGQIVFLYFLQKKGWLGAKEKWGDGDRKFLRNLFIECQKNKKNFFNDYLEYLFYDALNNEHRGGADPSIYLKFNCKIPFLNGGLFNEDYDWRNTDIKIENELFSNKRNENDEGSGILDIFDLYNFTVKEDEPLEKEVAVDPEMLGKVFENLLEVKGRKSKGTYYTPREIVHYMCQESLINYLTTELKDKIKKEDIEIFIKYGETVVEHETEVKSIDKETKTYSYKLPKSIRNNAKLIDEKLATIRVCDPAVGSGAFLVGMMNKIIRVRNVLTPYFRNKKGKTIYNFKRHAIQNCLYGVDIDPGATEIAKLRLWLSLVVEEKNIKQIKPLPNLDYKIMQGNSLIELLSGEFLISSIGQRRIELVNKLKKSKDELFDITSPSQKEQKRQEIDELIKEIFEYDRNLIIDGLRQKIRGIQNQGRLFKDAKFEAEDKKRIEEIKDKIKEFQKIRIPGPSEHFEWHINFSEIFQEKGGFDVVIANPPYIDSESMVKKGHENVREAIQKTYVFTKGNWDIYIAFFELAFKKTNDVGVITFITPDKWISKPFGDELRKNMIKNIYLIVRAGREIFESSKVDSIISFFSKRQSQKIKILEFKDKIFIEKREIDKKIMKEPFALDWLFSDYLELLIKINLIPTKASSLGNCENACATSDAYKLESLIKNLSNDFNRKNKLKIINTGTIGKYYSKWGKQDMTYLGHKYPNPIVEKEKFHSLFKNSYAKKSIQPKIIIKGLNLLDACLDIAGDTIPGKSTLIVTSENTNKLKLLLAIINSKLAYFYLQERYVASSYNQGISFTKDMINNLPTPKVAEKKQKAFIELVDKILTITKSNDYLENSSKQAKVRDYEKEINQLVYKLYGLTKKEIKIIEFQK